GGGGGGGGGARGGLAWGPAGRAPPGRGWGGPRARGRRAGLRARLGRGPTPPYIRHGRADEGDAERYQTVYARRAGAVAAPTAGLHFTPEVFAALRGRGVETACLTLHVGPGTVQPVKLEDVRLHRREPGG